jgi:hypothetical protein
MLPTESNVNAIKEIQLTVDAIVMPLEEPDSHI